MSGGRCGSSGHQQHLCAPRAAPSPAARRWGLGLGVSVPRKQIHIYILYIFFLYIFCRSPQTERIDTDFSLFLLLPNQRKNLCRVPSNLARHSTRGKIQDSFFCHMHSYTSKTRSETRSETDQKSSLRFSPDGTSQLWSHVECSARPRSEDNNGGQPVRLDRVSKCPRLHAQPYQVICCRRQ